MKKYEMPEIEVIEFDVEDVITESSGEETEKLPDNMTDLG